MRLLLGLSKEDRSAEQAKPKAWILGFREASCPYCKEQLSVPYDTKRHLTRLLTPGNPRVKDGVHDIDEIRRLSEGHVATVRAVLARVHGSLSQEPQSGNSRARKAQCPFCYHIFARSDSLKRHLAAFVQLEDARAPDGVHDLEQIRAMVRDTPKKSSASRKGLCEPDQQYGSSLEEVARSTEADGMLANSQGVSWGSSEAATASTDDLHQRWESADWESETGSSAYSDATVVVEQHSAELHWRRDSGVEQHAGSNGWDDLRNFSQRMLDRSSGALTSEPEDEVQRQRSAGPERESGSSDDSDVTNVGDARVSCLPLLACQEPRTTGRYEIPRTSQGSPATCSETATASSGTLYRRCESASLQSGVESSDTLHQQCELSDDRHTTNLGDDHGSRPRLEILQIPRLGGCG